MIGSLIQHISMRFILILSYCIVIPYCSSLVHVTSGWWLVHIVSYLLLLAVKRSIYTSLWFEYTLRYISNKRYWHCNKERFECTKGVIRDRTRRQRGIIIDKRKNEIFCGIIINMGSLFCIVCLSVIHGFWLPFWHLQAFIVINSWCECMQLEISVFIHLCRYVCLHVYTYTHTACMCSDTCSNSW